MNKQNFKNDIIQRFIQPHYDYGNSDIFIIKIMSGFFMYTVTQTTKLHILM